MSQRHWKEVDTAQSSDNWENSETIYCFKTQKSFWKYFLCIPQAPHLNCSARIFTFKNLLNFSHLMYKIDSRKWHFFQILELYVSNSMYFSPLLVSDENLLVSLEHWNLLYSIVSDLWTYKFERYYCVTTNKMADLVKGLVPENLTFFFVPELNNIDVLFGLAKPPKPAENSTFLEPKPDWNPTFLVPDPNLTFVRPNSSLADNPIFWSEPIYLVDHAK